MPEIVVAYTTVDSEKDALELAEKIVRSFHAACVNIFKGHATYHWKDELHCHEEWGMLIKTVSGHEKKLETFVLEHHPYEVPCFWVHRAEASEDFFNHVMNTLNQKERPAPL